MNDIHGMEDLSSLVSFSYVLSFLEDKYVYFSRLFE